MISSLLRRCLLKEQLLCSITANVGLISDGLAANPLSSPRSTVFQRRPHSTAAGPRSHGMSSTSPQGDGPTKLNLLECNSSATPHSQAIALMLSKDQMPADQLRRSMDGLSQQLLHNVASFSSTELSAFTEACRQIGYFHKEAFASVLQHLAPVAASIPADELPSLLWAGAQLAEANSSSSSASASPSSVINQSSAGSDDSSGRSRTTPVPSNDGVRGSVNSSRIAGLPGVVEFVLGAAQVLTSDVEDVATEELPVVAAALAGMEYRDPFLLTALAETAIERQPELTEPELLGLLKSFASMGCWFFDNRLLDGLTAEVVGRAQQGAVSQATVDAVAHALGAINHNNKALKQYLESRSSSSSSSGGG